ncbi:MAG: RNA-binding protein [Rhodospirillaceae bacterium]|jgi:uncharacterized protein|nr:RNA-binding protein [Rhodospirillaceae bacterium]MBT4220067.1 RNA-binding protein [Rhodospirillaceae bacterium]MBT4463188.1 RNA-binding protein [Rhodospirillaceae bacterium]MBT5012940.1 RNA-binding protein [Rhodospirillaceae bacterium]MBT6406551.1 RNA-binding protein [Rhodospirillaceae bacterium]
MIREKDAPGQRRCIVSGEMRPKAEMLRFVVAPDGDVVADIEEKLPGRGFWLSADRDVIHTASARNLFAKAARAKANAPDDLADRVEALLARRCLDQIGLARRAGIAVAGFGKVESWLKEKAAVGVVIAAFDGAADGRDKIRRLAGETPLVDVFSADELGHVFGRDHAVHAIVGPGKLAENLLRGARRLKGLRVTDAAS